AAEAAPPASSPGAPAAVEAPNPPASAAAPATPDAQGAAAPSEGPVAAEPSAPASRSAGAAKASNSETGYLLVPIEPVPPALAPLKKRPKKARPPRRHGDAGAPFALGIGGGFVWNDDPGYALVTEKRIPQLEVFASYDLLQPVKPLIISLGASLR